MPISVTDGFVENIMNFVRDHIIGPLSSVVVSGQTEGLEEKEVIALFMKTLEIKTNSNEFIPSIPKVPSGRKKKSGNTVEQRWISLDDFLQEYNEKYLCSYAQARGNNTNKFCGAYLTEDDLKAVGGAREELRCPTCKSKKGKKGKTLLQESTSKGIVPSVLGDNSNILKYMSGLPSGPSPSLAKSKEKPRFSTTRKGFKGLKEVDSVSKDTTGVNWVFRKDTNTIIGKLPSNVKSPYEFPSDYEFSLVKPLTEEEIRQCETGFSIPLKYCPVERPEISGPGSSDSESEQEPESEPEPEPVKVPKKTEPEPEPEPVKVPKKSSKKTESVKEKKRKVPEPSPCSEEEVDVPEKNSVPVEEPEEDVMSMLDNLNLEEDEDE